MKQLVYTSIAAPDVTGGDVFQIINQAADKNREGEITGVLAIAGGRFFQVLEGPGDKIESLMAVIEQDKRHHSVSVLVRRDIPERQFPCWSMRRIDIDDVTGAAPSSDGPLMKEGKARAMLKSFEAILNSKQQA